MATLQAGQVDKVSRRVAERMRRYQSYAGLTDSEFADQIKWPGKGGHWRKLLRLGTPDSDYKCLPSDLYELLAAGTGIPPQAWCGWEPHPLIELLDVAHVRVPTTGDIEAAKAVFERFDGQETRVIWFQAHILCGISTERVQNAWHQTVYKGIARTKTGRQLREVYDEIASLARLSFAQEGFGKSDAVVLTPALVFEHLARGIGPFVGLSKHDVLACLERIRDFVNGKHRAVLGFVTDLPDVVLRELQTTDSIVVAANGIFVRRQLMQSPKCKGPCSMAWSDHPRVVAPWREILERVCRDIEPQLNRRTMLDRIEHYMRLAEKTLT